MEEERIQYVDPDHSNSVAPRPSFPVRNEGLRANDFRFPARNED